MACAARTLTRATSALKTPVTTPLRAGFRTARAPAFRANGFRSQRRGYASEAGGKGGSSTGMIFGLGAVALLGAGGYLYATDSPMLSSVGLGGTPKPTGPFVPKKEDYQKVYDAVAEALIENDDYDDGSYAPVVLRLGWHASGTYDKETGTGGSNGATMRFAPEKDHGANAGLHAARDFLEPIKEKFPWISYSDLWTLAAVCAVQEMGGPTIPWRPGRADHDVSFCTPDGRLPDGAKDQKHLRAIFGRMGFNDQEIVALAGAHAVGRCHTDRSGFEGPWTFSPITFTNEYYRLLVEEKWHWRKWNGPAQFQDNTTNSLMMLPTDMSLIKDKNFKPWVEKYAKDQDLFFAHFGDAAMRLFELGVPFTSGEDARIEFKRTE